MSSNDITLIHNVYHLASFPDSVSISNHIMHLNERFIRFFIAGGIAAAVQYSILIALVEWFHWPPVPASALGYVLSAILNYHLNYAFTYRSQQAHLRTFLRFAVVATVGLSLNSFFMYVFAHVVGWHYLLAQIVSIGLVLLWNFTLNTLWSFRIAPDSGPNSRPG